MPSHRARGPGWCWEGTMRGGGGAACGGGRLMARQPPATEIMCPRLWPSGQRQSSVSQPSAPSLQPGGPVQGRCGSPGFVFSSVVGTQTSAPPRVARHRQPWGKKEEQETRLRGRDRCGNARTLFPRPPVCFAGPHFPACLAVQCGRRPVIGPQNVGGSDGHAPRPGSWGLAGSPLHSL